MKRFHLAPRRWWAAAVAGVLVASFGARAFAGGVTRPVLAADALALVVGAAVVSAGMRRADGLTPTARRWHAVLAAALLLGAVRAALWAAGLSVFRANLSALVLSGIALLVWAVRARRSPKRTPMP